MTATTIIALINGLTTLSTTLWPEIEAAIAALSSSDQEALRAQLVSARAKSDSDYSRVIAQLNGVPG